MGYLELLDQGLYRQAWQEMSPLFQMLEQREQWQDRQQLVRAIYGAAIKRAFYALDFRDHFLLSPDGQYVVVQFQTSFQFKASTRETVVLDCSTSPACSIREYVIN